MSSFYVFIKVVMNGILSNDPKSPCSGESTFGLGFVGNFINGVPSGVCWRELFGGSWIYGEVNQEGLFTGNSICA